MPTPIASRASRRIVTAMNRHMPSRHPKRRAYWQLMRGDRPIGTLLLLWPTLWALWLAAGGLPPLKLLLVFGAGVWLTRSAGRWRTSRRRPAVRMFRRSVMLKGRRNERDTGRCRDGATDRWRRDAGIDDLPFPLAFNPGCVRHDLRNRGWVPGLHTRLIGFRSAGCVEHTGRCPWRARGLSRRTVKDQRRHHSNGSDQ